MSSLLGSRGPTTIIDHDDGWLNMALVALIGAVLAGAGGWLVLASLRGLFQQPGAALFGATMGVALVGLPGWYVRRRWQVMQVARPGALIVPYWPLVAGERIQIAYQRPLLDPACRLRSLRGELVLEETCQEWDPHENRYETHTRTICRLALGDGGGRQTPEGLHALFRLTVPRPDGGCPREGLDAFKALFGLGRSRVWRLRVHHEVTGLTDCDSGFRIRIGPGGGAARRSREAA